jgi:hypothetical protein
MHQVQGQFNAGGQARQQMMNGIQDDANAEKNKTLMQTAIGNNRKVSRPTPGHPLPMQQNQQPSQAQMLAMKQQQQSQQVPLFKLAS